MLSADSTTGEIYRMFIPDRFPRLFERVRKDHIAVGLFGAHDIYHALRVAEYAYSFALFEWNDKRLAELAGIAGLLHNADHTIPQHIKTQEPYIERLEIMKIVNRWIGTGDNHNEYIRGDERSMISDAVLGHTGKNSDADSKILIALMDADRVVNMEADIIMRAGQFRPDIPAVDFVHFLNDPKATYQNPRSILRDINYCLDWVTEGGPVCVRTKLGKQLGKERAEFLRLYIETLKKQLELVHVLS